MPILNSPNYEADDEFEHEDSNGHYIDDEEVDLSWEEMNDEQRAEFLRDLAEEFDRENWGFYNGG